MKRYQVYKNLHKNCWSIRDAKTKHVVGHADTVQLFQVKYKVSKAGRERVLRDQRKSVHAVVEGEIVSVSGFTSFKGRSFQSHGVYPNLYSDRVYLEELTYNPYRFTHFVKKMSENLVLNSRMATLDRHGKLTGGFQSI